MVVAETERRIEVLAKLNAAVMQAYEIEAP